MTRPHILAFVQARMASRRFPGKVLAPLWGRPIIWHVLASVSVALPNLSDDVDTIDDLRRLHLRLGPRSQMCLAGLPAEALS